MADETNPTPNPGQPANPPASPPADQTPPATPPASPDTTKMAEELGKLKAENATLKEYQTKVDPVIQSIWSDEQLLKHTTDVHNKRLGVEPEPKKENGEKKEEISPEIAKIEKKVDEFRNTEIANKINSFYVRKGIDKLEEEAKKDINIKIGAILMDMLDPMGNKKELKEVLEDVPLPKLDRFLENAYDLATKAEQQEQARNEGKQEVATGNLGIIGSMPSQSPNPESVFLTAQDRNTAKNMGVSEEKWLEAKKQIEKNKGIYQGA